METMYYARPNEAGADLFAKWWGCGGAELWDKYDPRCLTEPRSSGGRAFLDFRGERARDCWVGPFSWREAGIFDQHARQIPGYHVPGRGYAIVWRQRAPIEEGEEVSP